jgi:hypothetical protein
MTRYLVSHRVKRIYASQDDLVNDWKGLRQRTHAEARWLASWWAAPTARLYCEWEAVSPEAIRACFQPAELEMAPIERIEEVVAIDPAWLD